MGAGLGAEVGGGDEVDVAADGALVGHEAADEGDLLAVGGEARHGDLQAVEWGRGGGWVEERAWDGVEAIDGMCSVPDALVALVDD